MGIQDWLMIGSVAVSVLALIDMLHVRSQGNAREDGKTAEILREVNEKLTAITDQEITNSGRIETIVERLVVVEQSTKQAHHRIDEIRDEIHK